VQYQYTTSSNAGDDLFFKFFWGDNTESEWIGPYGNGEPASASNSWEALGNYQITAIVKIGEGGIPSSPSAPLAVRMYKLGDVNGDDLTNFGDINAFVFALTSGEAGYYIQYPSGFYYTADCNIDGLVNFGDINPFVALLSG